MKTKPQISQGSHSVGCGYGLPCPCREKPKTQVSHTLTPWEYAGKGSAIEAKVDGLYELVAFTNGDEENYQANAAYIVRAVNAHEELLEALQNIEANLTGPDNMRERIVDSLRRAKEAIAKATGGK